MRTRTHPRGVEASGMTVAGIFATAVAWALIPAFVHVVTVAWRVHVLHGFSQTTQQFPLTAPLAYALLFSIAAFPLALVARLNWRVGTAPAVNGLFAGLAIFSILLLYRRIHPMSYVVLALGLGWQVSQWVSRNPRAIRPLTRFVAPVLAVLMLINGAWPFARSRWREASAIREPPTAGNDAPNVLLLILDTVRAANLGTYGYYRATSPALDSLARDGVVFEQAYSTASWSLPAHASMLTGVWGHETGGDYLRRIRDDLPTVAEVLSRNGYLTGAFMGNASWAGHETGIQRGFHRFVSYRSGPPQLVWNTTLTQTPLFNGVAGGLVRRDPGRVLHAIREFNLRADFVTPANLRTAGEITDAFLSWRRNQVADRHPWFATLNVIDAHDPYDTPFDQRFNNGRTPLDKYDGAIAYVDSIAGRLFHELELLGDLDKTLIIVTSDHGEKFGEHGEFEHSGSLYLPVVHVPLLVRYPARLSPGTRRGDLRTTADIPATILDVTGVRDPRIPGASLVHAPAPGDSSPLLFLSNRNINPEPADPTAAGDILGAITPEWHLIRFPEGAEELYRWRVDPAETVNLADTPEGRAILPSLRQALRGRRAR